MTQTATTLAPDAQTAICDALNQCVAETTVATMVAQNFHWNVTGMAFGPLHDLFQTIYEDHFAAADDLAERVKALDGFVDGRLSVMLDRSKVQDHAGDVPAETMIKALCAAEETLAATLAGTAAVAEDHGDLLTQDLAIARGQTHEKFAWMLRSHLK